METAVAARLALIVAALSAGSGAFLFDKNGDCNDCTRVCSYYLPEDASNVTSGGACEAAINMAGAENLKQGDFRKDIEFLEGIGAGNEFTLCEKVDRFCCLGGWRLIGTGAVHRLVEGYVRETVFADNITITN